MIAYTEYKDELWTTISKAYLEERKISSSLVEGNCEAVEMFRDTMNAFKNEGVLSRDFFGQNGCAYDLTPMGLIRIERADGNNMPFISYKEKLWNDIAGYYTRDGKSSMTLAENNRDEVELFRKAATSLQEEGLVEGRMVGQNKFNYNLTSHGRMAIETL